ncbi:MAG: hypothetical protein LC689_19275 [Myxococcales bacterium]|nr:hypothetical protein [Myxococcales bacterium]
MPGPLPAMAQYQTTYDVGMPHGVCLLPIGEGHGNVALETSAMGHPTWTVLDKSGQKMGAFGAQRGEAWPDETGFIMYAGVSPFGPNPGTQMTEVDAWNPTGTAKMGGTAVTGSAIFAPNPVSGLLAVGHFALGSASPPQRQMAIMFTEFGAIGWGPVVLLAEATVFGLGTDLLGRSLIILDGGSGNVDAIWLDDQGRTSVPQFRLLSRFQAGASTWFETSPLIGGGLAIRRMDAIPSLAFSEVRSSEWLLLLASNSNDPQPAPDWLKQRPNTDLQIMPSRRAYETVPWAAEVSSCNQQIEVLSPTGNSCGRLDFSVDREACTTRPLRVGQDGTVMQMLPASREPHPLPSVYGCTLRFWPAALR